LIVLGYGEYEMENETDKEYEFERLYFKCKFIAFRKDINH